MISWELREAEIERRREQLAGQQRAAATALEQRNKRLEQRAIVDSIVVDQALSALGASDEMASKVKAAVRKNCPDYIDDVARHITVYETMLDVQNIKK